MVDVVSSTIEKMHYRGRIENSEYQVALFRPKWKNDRLPEAVRLAKEERFNHKRYFISNDPILRHLMPDEILHLQPEIRSTSDTDYCQVVATHSATGDEWIWLDQYCPPTRHEKTALETIVGLCGCRIPRSLDYHNCALFESQLHLLLYEMVEAHNNGKSILDILKSRKFRLAKSKLSIAATRRI